MEKSLYYLKDKNAVQGQAGQPYFHLPGLDGLVFPDQLKNKSDSYVLTLLDVKSNICKCNYKFMQYFRCVAVLDVLNQDSIAFYLSDSKPFNEKEVSTSSGYQWKFYDFTTGKLLTQKEATPLKIYQYIGCCSKRSNVGVWTPIQSIEKGTTWCGMLHNGYSSDSSYYPELTTPDLPTDILLNKVLPSLAYIKLNATNYLYALMIVSNYECCNGTDGCGYKAEVGDTKGDVKKEFLADMAYSGNPVGYWQLWKITQPLQDCYFWCQPEDHDWSQYFKASLPEQCSDSVVSITINDNTYYVSKNVPPGSVDLYYNLRGLPKHPVMRLYTVQLSDCTLYLPCIKNCHSEYPIIPSKKSDLYFHQGLIWRDPSWGSSTTCSLKNHIFYIWTFNKDKEEPLKPTGLPKDFSQYLDFNNVSLNYCRPSKEFGHYVPYDTNCINTLEEKNKFPCNMPLLPTFKYKEVFLDTVSDSEFSKDLKYAHIRIPLYVFGAESDKPVYGETLNIYNDAVSRDIIQTVVNEDYLRLCEMAVKAANKILPNAFEIYHSQASDPDIPFPIARIPLYACFLPYRNLDIISSDSDKQVWLLCDFDLDALLKGGSLSLQPIGCYTTRQYIKSKFKKVTLQYKGILYFYNTLSELIDNQCVNHARVKAFNANILDLPLKNHLLVQLKIYLGTVKDLTLKYLHATVPIKKIKKELDTDTLPLGSHVIKLAASYVWYIDKEDIPLPDTLLLPIIILNTCTHKTDFLFTDFYIKNTNFYNSDSIEPGYSSGIINLASCKRSERQKLTGYSLYQVPRKRPLNLPYIDYHFTCFAKNTHTIEEFNDKGFIDNGYNRLNPYRKFKTIFKVPCEQLDFLFESSSDSTSESESLLLLVLLDTRYLSAGSLLLLLFNTDNSSYLSLCLASDSDSEGPTIAAMGFFTVSTEDTKEGYQEAGLYSIDNIQTYLKLKGTLYRYFRYMYYSLNITCIDYKGIIQTTPLDWNAAWEKTDIWPWKYKHAGADEASFKFDENDNIVDYADNVFGYDAGWYGVLLIQGNPNRSLLLIPLQIEELLSGKIEVSNKIIIKQKEYIFCLLRYIYTDCFYGLDFIGDLLSQSCPKKVDPVFNYQVQTRVDEKWSSLADAFCLVKLREHRSVASDFGPSGVFPNYSPNVFIGRGGYNKIISNLLYINDEGKWVEASPPLYGGSLKGVDFTQYMAPLPHTRILGDKKQLADLTKYLFDITQTPDCPPVYRAFVLHINKLDAQELDIAYSVPLKHDAYSTNRGPLDIICRIGPPTDYNALDYSSIGQGGQDCDKEAYALDALDKDKTNLYLGSDELIDIEHSDVAPEDKNYKNYKRHHYKYNDLWKLFKQKASTTDFILYDSDSTTALSPLPAIGYYSSLDLEGLNINGGGNNDLLRVYGYRGDGKRLLWMSGDSTEDGYYYSNIGGVNARFNQALLKNNCQCYLYVPIACTTERTPYTFPHKLHIVDTNANIISLSDSSLLLLPMNLFDIIGNWLGKLGSHLNTGYICIKGNDAWTVIMDLTRSYVVWIGLAIARHLLYHHILNYNISVLFGNTCCGCKDYVKTHLAIAVSNIIYNSLEVSWEMKYIGLITQSSTTGEYWYVYETMLEGYKDVTDMSTYKGGPIIKESSDGTDMGGCPYRTVIDATKIIDTRYPCENNSDILYCTLKATDQEGSCIVALDPYSARSLKTSFAMEDNEELQDTNGNPFFSTLRRLSGYVNSQDNGALFKIVYLNYYETSDSETTGSINIDFNPLGYGVRPPNCSTNCDGTGEAILKIEIIDRQGTWGLNVGLKVLITLSELFLLPGLHTITIKLPAEGNIYKGVGFTAYINRKDYETPSQVKAWIELDKNRSCLYYEWMYGGYPPTYSYKELNSFVINYTIIDPLKPQNSNLT